MTIADGGVIQGTGISYLEFATNITATVTNTTASISATGTGGGGLTTKSNAIANTSFTGNPKKATVTYTTAFPNTNYGITITGDDARSWTIESKATTGFTINSNSNIGLAGTTYWHAIAYGEA